MSTQKSNLAIDWCSESDNTTEKAREIYQTTNVVENYDFEQITTFIDDTTDDEYYSSLEDDDYTEQRNEDKKIKRKIKKLSKKVKKCEKRIAKCEKRTEDISSDVSFLKKAHLKAEKGRKNQLWTQLINESDYENRKKISNELLCNKWECDEFDGE